MLMLQSNCGDLSDTPVAAALKSRRAFLTGNLASAADKGFAGNYNRGEKKPGRCDRGSSEIQV